MCCQNSVLEVLVTSHVRPLREDPWGLVPGSLQTLSHTPFPIAGFALRPFTVISHSHAYDCRLSPVSSPSKSNLGVVLGMPDIGLLWILSEIIHTEHLTPCQASTKHRLIREKRPCTKQVSTSLLCVPLPRSARKHADLVCLPPKCGIPHCYPRNDCR